MKGITDVLVIGGGPAGLSVGLTLARQLKSCIIFDSGSYRNYRSHYMHMVTTWDHAEPENFRAAGRKELLSRYDTASIEQAEIMTVRKTDQGLFEAATGKKTWIGRKLVLATGVEVIYPNIDGYDECWAKGVYHCFFCKGFEDRSVPSAGVLAIDVLANPAHALHAARHVTPFCKAVTIYTNGSTDLASQLEEMFGNAGQMETDTRRIKKLVKGPNKSEIIIHFDDGSEVTEGFLGHVPKTKVKGPFAEQLGLEMTPTGEIKASAPFPQTNVHGVFACGDVAAPTKFTLNAQYQGCLAASGIAGQLIAEELGQKTLF